MKLRSLALACAAVAALAPAALADSPQNFIQKAIQGDNSEVMLGRLAQRNAVSPAVRDFGRMLVNDHSNARGEAMRVAYMLRVRPTDSVAPEALRERDRLSRLSGREFDREFVRYMIDDHRKDIADFREEMREDHGPASRLAERQLPTLQRHLNTALSLRDDVRPAGYRNNDDRGRFDRDRYDRDRYNRDYNDNNNDDDNGAYDPNRADRDRYNRDRDYNRDNNNNDDDRY
ncbi:MAG: DUF4142 domain-containing protein [Alphaproteobacteria bacterium]|nr:DUF4142 domain-containing protein [Alphaproteobacteria bacterium]